MIKVEGLTKKYGKNLAVNNVSFSVAEGEIVGVLGPNGAGKSTLMNMLTGYISSSYGKIEIGGNDILEKPAEAKKAYRLSSRNSAGISRTHRCGISFFRF